MTFEQFCRHHNVSQDERAALSSYQKESTC
jgi:hypothetical protein